MPLDDIEQDEAPKDKTTVNSLNTRNRTNTKRDNVDEDLADELSDTRTDNDGGHNRNRQPNRGSGGSQSGGNRQSGGSQNRDSDLALADFVRDLFGTTSGASSGGSGGGGTSTGGRSTGGRSTGGTSTGGRSTGGSQSGSGQSSGGERSTTGRSGFTGGGGRVQTTGGGSGGGNTGGGNTGGNDSDETPPKDDEFIDNTPNNGEENTGSDRDGKFGSGTPAEPPKFHFERADTSRRSVNKSKGTYIEYKGVQYPIDRKGTEYSDTETDVAKQEAAWGDDTFTVGKTVISLKDYFNKTDEERKKLLDDALDGGSTPKSTDQKLYVLSVKQWIQPDAAYGMTVTVKLSLGYNTPQNEYEGQVPFDSSGYVTVEGIKFYATNVLLSDTGETVAQWLSKLVDSQPRRSDGSLDDSPIRTEIGWGLRESADKNTDTPEDENPVTNPVDPEQKLPAKEKSSDSPEGAPENVENSKALTTARLRELTAKNSPVPAAWRVTHPNHSGEVAVSPPGGTYGGTKTWGFRARETEGLGGAANELKVPESKLTRSVKWYFGGTWEGLTRKPILGVDIPKDERLLKFIDYPIIMNFPEVGIPNTAVPYVAENQTEQHRMVVKSSVANFSKYGIGTFSGKPFANWAEQPHWCGYFSLHACNHSGYRPKISGIKWSIADGSTAAYSEVLPNPVTKDSTGTYGNLPMFVNPETKNWEVDPEIYKMGSPAGGGGDARAFNRLYPYYKKTHVVKPKEEQKTVIVKGKPQTKIIKTEEKIAIEVYESLLPDPISIYFINGVHFNSSGLTDMGKKLIEHFLSQKGWEASIITRGTHVELCGYLDPDGTMLRLGGNTGSGSVSGAGGQFAIQQGWLWTFSKSGRPASLKPGFHTAFHKLVIPEGGESQKIDNTMNGQFRRTELVDNYYKALANGNKNVLQTLARTLYDKVVEPG